MKIRFNDDQLKALSAIAADAGQVFLASAVVPILFGIENLNLRVLFFGLILTLICWATSVIIARGSLK